MNMGRQTRHTRPFIICLFNIPAVPTWLELELALGYLAIGKGEGESTSLIGSNSGSHRAQEL